MEDSGNNPSNQAYDAGSWSGSPHAASQPSPPFSYAPLDQVEQNKDPHFQPPFPSPPTDSTLCTRPPLPKMERLHPVVYDNSSSSSSDVYYPRVRYIFDDDDPDLLSSALSTQHRLLEKEWSDNEPPALTNQDRAILLDFSPSSNGRGYEVSRAISLSADWVVTGARLGHMEMGSSPSGTENDTQDDPWMLAIEGVKMLAGAETHAQGMRTAVNSTLPHPSDEGGKSLLSKEKNEPVDEDYNTLIQGFNVRMDLLKRMTLNSDRQNCPSSGNIRRDDVILLSDDNSRQAD